MFAGHLAVALGAKGVAPRAPLSALVAGAFGLDLLWPVLLLLGVEHVRIEPGATAFTPLAFDDYPWSHSLALAVVWGTLAGVLAYSALRNAGVSLLIGVMVVSHWVLDWLTHRPDLPLWPGGPMTGLGLWNSIGGTLVVEGALFAAAVVLYGRRFRARDRIGSWAFWSLVVFVGAIWVSGPWSPPPPSSTAIAWVGLSLSLLPIWAGWADRHHVATGLTD